jgi:hypothetical protein
MGKYEREALERERAELMLLRKTCGLSEAMGRRLDEIEKRLDVGQFQPVMLNPLHSGDSERG